MVPDLGGDDDCEDGKVKTSSRRSSKLVGSRKYDTKYDTKHVGSLEFVASKPTVLVSYSDKVITL